MIFRLIVSPGEDYTIQFELGNTLKNIKDDLGCVWFNISNIPLKVNIVTFFAFFLNI